MRLMDPPVDVGTTKRLRQYFTLPGAVETPITPGSVTLTFQDPDAAEFDVPTSQDEYGAFYGDGNVATSGQWRYRWVTENPRLIVTGSFVVRRNPLTDYEPIDFDGSLDWEEWNALNYEDWNSLDWSHWE